MHRDRRLTVLVETEHPLGRPGRCKFCGAGIIFRLSAPGGKWMPFNKHPLVLSEFTNELTGVKFEQLSPEDLHFASCTNRPRKKPKADVLKPGPLAWRMR